MRQVLIIDDDRDLRRGLGEILSAAGWQVLEADNGALGVSLARMHRPQVVLCDLLMPGGNGFQVCLSLRADPALRTTKIVVITGRQFGTDRQAALDAGADEYIAKPFDLQSICGILSRLVPDAAPEPQLTPPQPERTPTAFRFWGVRGSIPTPGPGTVQIGGNTTCLEVRAEGQIIVFDAGTGMRLLGKHLNEEFQSRPIHVTVFLTHTHWDHIHGLPFFSPVYSLQNRIRILGYEGARNSLQNVLSSQMERPYFPINLRELPAAVQIEELKEMSIPIGEVQVTACFANHPGICVGYKLTAHDGSLAFFPDNEPYLSYRRVPRPASEAEASRLTFAQAEESRLLEFLRGTEVLVMDTQYDAEEYASHIGWGHGCLDDVVELAMKCGIKRLFMFHHDPEHDDARLLGMLDYARKIVADRKGTLEVDLAREGDSFHFGKGTRLRDPS
jgi:phosphoribosyl 1,2-cyclic phosphodiesterase/ActR/RegA family two-component response regulator